MSDPSSDASKSLEQLQRCITFLVESGGSGSQETWLLNEAREAFKTAFKHDKIVSLTAVLDHLSECTLEKVSLPNFFMGVKETEEMKRELTHLVRSNIIDFLKESLEKESEGELQKLAKSIEGRDFLDEDKFQVSNASHVDSFVSCLQVAVSVRGICLKLLALVNKRILPDFHELPEKRKLDILRGFAEISPFTPTLLAEEMRPLVTALLKKYIPSKKKKKFDEVNSSTHLECILFIFHQLAYKAAKASLSKILKESLERLKNITKERIEELAQTLCHDNAFIREFENETPKPGKQSRVGLEKFFSGRRRHNTKAEIRTCINLLAMIDELQSKSISFMGDNSVKLSWKEAKEPVLGEAYRPDTWTAPIRPALLDSLPKDLRESLRFSGTCYPDDETIKSLISTSSFQQVEQKRDSRVLLNDRGGVAMLCWQIKEEFSEFRDKDIGKKGSTGGVRDQLFHIICWAYAASDLSRGKLEPDALNENSPFCTWYLCAFCVPELLGSEPRKDEDGEEHHCYGTTIETGLVHIKKYGVPREYCPVFSCTDYHPPSAEEPRMCKRKITGIRRISTLKEALEELKNQAVGADLIDYTGLFFKGKRVYCGPYTPTFVSDFRTYHSVIMEALEIVDGELCVACKMSNGEEVGDDGYVYVSLRTVYMPLGAIEEQRKHVRISSEPMHLLTNFVVPEFEKVVEEKKDEGKKDEGKDDEKKEGEEDEEEDDEEEKEKEEEEEEEEYVPIARRRNRGLCAYRSAYRSSLADRMPVLDAATNGPAYPPIVAYQSSSLKIEFTFSKPSGNPHTTYATNSLKQYLNHTNQYVVGLALCALGNICSAEIARDLAPEVERLIQFRDPKKAALCSTRIVRKVPDLAENAASSLLKEKHHGVLITGVQLCYELCTINDEALEFFRKKCTEGLIKTLRDITNSAYQPEYDVAGITDPFLHIRLLELLRVLGQGDADARDLMTDILAQVATKTESNKNAGNAVLCECVETIMAIEDTSSLRVLAINILGRFLSNRDNNIRYVALNMLMKAIAFDDQAVQRHRVTILECVKVPDASIRKRALDLVSLLVNENNVKQLTKELIDYLEISDEDFKAKICSIVEKFSPEKIWYIDQMLKVLSEAGKFVKDDVWHALIVVISNASELHGYTVRALYKAVLTYSEQETLVRVAIWCIGEYGDLLVNNVGMLGTEDPITVTECDAVDVVEDAISRHNSMTTKAMALVALLKLSSRFPSISERFKDVTVEQEGSLLLEMQQRAIEFNSIVDRHTDIRSSLVERMSLLDEATFSVRSAGSLPASVSTIAKPSVSIPNGVL